MYANRWWYLPAAASLAAADLFVIVIPTEAILVSTIMLRPKRWLIPVIWISSGSAVGAGILAYLTSRFGEPFIEQHFSNALHGPGWQKASDFLTQYGDWALAVFSAGPLPQQPAVVLCALAHMSWTWIVLSVLAGRLAKYLLFGWAATHAPKLFSTVLRSPEAQKAIEKSAKRKS